MTKIKILTISTSGFARKEGISTVLLDNYLRFDKNAFELHIVVSGIYNYELIQEFETSGVTIRYLPSRKKNILLYISALVALFKQEKYHALYVHGSSAIMSIELLIAKMCGCKTRVVHSHNTTCDHKNVDRLLRPLFYRLYTNAIACGDDAGKWLFGDRSFVVQKNGRDVNKYRYNENTRGIVREKVKVGSDELLIGHVGNFNKQKNQKYALVVFKEVLEKRENARLFLMGEGTLIDEVKELAIDMGIQDKVVFTGSISNIHEMLQAMDVMILPSLHEGLPLVVIEWQIAALPCIISNVVTKECCYSDLVRFLPLDNPKDWSENVLEMATISRDSLAERQVELTRENGFDINQNAIELQHFFMGSSERGQ